MGRKIFVSYKYRDSNVYGVPNVLEPTHTVRDYVTWLEDKFNDRTDHIYKGESDNEDLSNRSDDYIWQKLKDRIYDSTLTIIFISPNMKENGLDRSQWIPWEISYSLKETPRGGYTSHSNAVLAVILPDRYNNYNYYNVNSLFDILKANIVNGYIPVVKWDNFKYNCDYYIDKAYKTKESVPSYKVQKSV